MGFKNWIERIVKYYKTEKSSLHFNLNIECWVLNIECLYFIPAPTPVCSTPPSPHTPYQ
jgi:hypothetical protein